VGEQGGSPSHDFKIDLQSILKFLLWLSAFICPTCTFSIIEDKV